MRKDALLVKTDDVIALADVGGVTPLKASTFDDMVIEQVVALEDGQEISGIYRGPGETVAVINNKDVEISDPATGETVTEKREVETELPTWRVEVAPDKIACVLGTSSLNRKMTSPQAIEGRRVSIGRIGLVRTRRGMQVARFLVGWEKAKK